MQDKLFQFGVERQSVLGRLFRGLFHRYDNIAEVMLVGRFEFVGLMRKRKNVCRRIFAAKHFVQLSHSPVRHERDRKTAAFCLINGFGDRANERLERFGIQLNFTLKIYYHIVTE